LLEIWPILQFITCYRDSSITFFYGTNASVERTYAEFIAHIPNALQGSVQELATVCW